MAAKKNATFEMRRFEFDSANPLATAHGLVSAWIDQSLEGVPEHSWYQDVDLKTKPAGLAILNGDKDQSREFVLAAVAQMVHYDSEALRVKSVAKDENERINAHFLPGWRAVWGRRRKAEAVISTLLRRSLPFTSDDLVQIINWCAAPDAAMYSYHAPLGSIVRAIVRFAESTPPPTSLLEVLKIFAARLRESRDKEISRLATSIEQLLVCASDEPIAQSTPSKPKQRLPVPTVHPAAAGNPLMLCELKKTLGLPGQWVSTDTEVIGPDLFPMRRDSPLKEEHKQLTAFFNGVIGTTQYATPDLSSSPIGREILEADNFARGRYLLAATERAVHGAISPITLQDHRVWQSRHSAAALTSVILKAGVDFDRNGLFDYSLYFVACGARQWDAKKTRVADFLIEKIQAATGNSPLTDGERYTAQLLRMTMIDGPPLGSYSEAVSRLTAILQDDAAFFLVPGEVWSDAVNADISSMDDKKRAAWVALLRQLLTATSTKPTAKWLATTVRLVDGIGKHKLGSAIEKWFPLVNGGRSAAYRIPAYYSDRSAGDLMQEENAIALRGLLWIAPSLETQGIARLIAIVAQSAYRKVPGVGPRAVKVGNAGIYALSNLKSSEAVGQLAVLKARVKFGTAQKEIAKAFDTAAAAMNIPRDEIEELGVPTYGMEAVGRREETLGEFKVVVRVNGRLVSLEIYGPDGKHRKGVPAKLKSDHKEDLKEIQLAVKDLAAMLPTQAERVDSLFLSQKQWPIATWRARYLDHPLVGTLARRLIWTIDNVAVLFDGTQLLDLAGNPVEFGKMAEVALWHPIGRSIDEIVAWRERIESLQIIQPFKQAHRELYLLTDAERRTGTYSNRFAGHIIRQHQFNALAAARGWKHKLRLMVDDVYPPATKDLPQWSLRAEYWVEGAGNEYGSDTNDSGVYLRLATDQVRFYHTDAATNLAHAGGGGYTSRAAGPGANDINAQVRLDQIPPVVLSEVLRDVDLFVGVASVGNDPAWQDGGPDGRYRTYWHEYSFGELSATAATRKLVLARLVPRLKIADRCSLTDRFLIVRGLLRTYKIHLGSGNILMEPNDQYLCIVPNRSTRAGDADVFLPFEGDGTLSVIISKAFLLAADDKIKDATITRQIKA